MKKSSLSQRFSSILVAALCLSSLAEPAHAYAGLGPMLPMIGSGLVLGFVFLMTILGAVLYPLRIFCKKFFPKKAKTASPSKK